VPCERLGDRERLEAWLPSAAIQAGLAQRARILLPARDGLSNVEIAARVGCQSVVSSVPHNTAERPRPRQGAPGKCRSTRPSSCQSTADSRESGGRGQPQHARRLPLTRTNDTFDDPDPDRQFVSSPEHSAGEAGEFERLYSRKHVGTCKVHVGFSRPPPTLSASQTRADLHPDLVIAQQSSLRQRTEGSDLGLQKGHTMRLINQIREDPGRIALSASAVVAIGINLAEMIGLLDHVSWIQDRLPAITAILVASSLVPLAAMLTAPARIHKDVIESGSAS
jgi:hypothetical protein